MCRGPRSIYLCVTTQPQRPDSEPSKRMTFTAAADALRERIVQGTFPPESRLPPAMDLTAEIGASYVTILKAVKLLEDEGFLHSRHGVGTFVTAHPPHAFECRLILGPNPLTGGIQHSRFWEVLCDESGHIGERFAPWRVRPSGPVAAHPDNVAYCELVESIHNGGVAGLMFPSGLRPYLNTPVVEHAGVARACVGDGSRRWGVSHVGIDVRLLVERACERARQAGRSRIAFLGPLSPIDAANRKPGAAAWLAACAASHGLETREGWILPVAGPDGDLAQHCVRLLMDRPAPQRPDALLTLDDHLVTPAGEALAADSVDTEGDLLFLGYSNFPDRPKAPVPVLRIGFDIHALFEHMLAAIRHQKLTGRITHEDLPPVFEDELAGH